MKTTFQHNQKRRRCPARAGFVEKEKPTTQGALGKVKERGKVVCAGYPR